MTDILIWLEHHPALTLLITTVAIAFLSAVGWIINLRRATKEKGPTKNISAGHNIICAERDVIVGDQSKITDTDHELQIILKEFVLFLDEFGENIIVTKTYDEYLFKMKGYKELFCSLLAGLQGETSMLQNIKDIYDNIQNFLNQPLYCDGGKSWAKQLEYINNCKDCANKTLGNIKGGGK